jgi:acyl-CoA synthetase (NDP forming)
MSLKEVFYPYSIAVIGASSDEEKERIGWVGRLKEFGYNGRIYPINPKGSEIFGYKIYPSIREISECIDYAIIAVRAQLVPQALEDCVNNGVKVVHIYTAGFAETGKEKGKKLQEEIVKIIQRGKIRVIGPNCMGVYCPASGMTFNARFPTESGAVGVISQSGAALLGLIPQAAKKNIRFSKVVSYGNGIDLESTELLEYLINDLDTKLIFCYIEGIKDGHRFFEAARKCVEKGKPLIVLKGGMTEGGKEAAASHTASLAGSVHIWQAFFLQSGATVVETFDEAVEQIIAFQHFRPPKGRAIGIVTRGGGPGVIATDQCEKAGLFVPAFASETRDQLEKMTPSEAGSSVRNPAEIGLGRAGLSQYYSEGLKLVDSDSNIDMILTQVNPHLYTQYGIGAKQVEDTIDVLIQVSKELTKPMVVVMPLGDSMTTIEPVLKAHEKSLKEGLAIFSDMGVAIKSISKVIQNFEFVGRLAR